MTIDRALREVVAKELRERLKWERLPLDNSGSLTGHGLYAARSGKSQE